jgi:predicted transcriptional regulator
VRTSAPPPKEINMLDRHLEVLGMVIENEPVGIVRMSDETGYRHHKIRYSLRVLEEENLIEPTSKGATTTDQTSGFVDNIDANLETVNEKLNEMKLETTVETHQ